MNDIAPLQRDLAKVPVGPSTRPAIKIGVVELASIGVLPEADWA